MSEVQHTCESRPQEYQSHCFHLVPLQSMNDYPVIQILALGLDPQVTKSLRTSDLLIASHRSSDHTPLIPDENESLLL